MRHTALALTLLCPPAMAAAPWMRVPPTPALPPPSITAKIDSAGARIWCAAYGDPARPAVVLVHGGLANASYWGGLIADLRRDHRVIVLDSRGHGRSTLGTTPIGYEQMARDTLAVLDYFGVQRAALVGWSDGGIIGLTIAWHHPERLTRLFAFAANSDPSGTHDPLPGNLTFAAYVERTGGEYRQLSPAPDAYPRFRAAVEAMWKNQPHMTAADLEGVRVPTWIVDGDRDEVIWRANTDFMAQHIPEARELILPGVSHFAFLQDPAMFGYAVRRFLDEP